MDDPDLFAHQTLTERYLKNFNGFLENYSEQMIQLLLNDESNDGKFTTTSSSSTNPTLVLPSTKFNPTTEIPPLSLCTTNVESLSSYPIELVWEKLEELLTLEELMISPVPPTTITTTTPSSSYNNNGLNHVNNTTGTGDLQKVMLVLVSLTSQLKEQYKYGWKHFVYQLMLYGDAFENMNMNNNNNNGHGSSNNMGNSSNQSFTTSTTEGDAHITLSKFIPILYKLEEFTTNGYQLLLHTIQQLSSLFKDSKPHVVTITGTGLHLSSVFHEIGTFLSLFIILDEIILNQSILQQHWLKYKRMVKSVRADTNTFGIDSIQLLDLEKNLAKLDKNIMSAHLFYNIMEKIQTNWKINNNSNSNRRQSSSSSSSSKNNILLIEQFTYELTRISLTLEKDFHEGIEQLKPIAFTALFLLSTTLFTPPTFDSKKIFSRIVWENLKRIPAVPIGGTYLWIPEIFLNSFQKQLQQLNTHNHHHHRSSSTFASLYTTNQLITTKLLRTQQSTRESYLDNRMNSLSKDVTNIQYQVLHWTLQLQQIFHASSSTKLTRNQLNLEDLISKCNLLIHGTKLAQSINLSFRLLINLHVVLGKSITKQVVAYLCQYMELLKLIQSTFALYNKQICQTIMVILQTVIHIALTQIQSISEALLNSNGSGTTPNSSTTGNGHHHHNINLDKDELRRDGLNVIKILEYILKGSPTQERLLIAKIAFDWIVLSSRYWKDNDQKLTIEAALERILTISEIQEKIHSICNCCDIYWHRILFNSYFSYLYKNELESSKLQFSFLIFQDCISMINENCEFNYHKEDILNNFINEVEEYANVQIVDKLCQDIETDLRLQSHSHLQQQQQSNQQSSLIRNNETSPFRIGVKDYNALLNIPQLQLNDKRIYVKNIVENYLSKNFYNLASVALHDWQSYSTMRVLAWEKYQLSVVQDHLPGHSLEQGLDILSIVRNLNKFVVEYSYNLNNQVFIQMQSPNKHFETVSIRHLANSMRTHGPGMANTTVNFAYKFLRTKIRIFSQFLYDEQIKSRLSRDIRHFKQGRHTLDTNSSSSSSAIISSYSFQYDRAIKFQRGIRKLGVNSEGLSPLDQFRVLITHIGNALGFVRLVRSGCLHFLAAGSRFVIDFLDEVPQFTDLEELGKNITNNELQEELKRSSNCLSNILGTFLSTGSTIDYFSLLTKAFAAPCRSESNIHMKNFYVIIPALTLSYVDHMRICKEKLTKKSKGSSLFTDDGFAMGVAYLLKVLGQDADFDSLQWFSGISRKLLDERKAALQTISEAKSDEKLQQASTLTAKRLQDILQEFHLLRYNLSSARIFFQKSELVLSTNSPKQLST